MTVKTGNFDRSSRHPVDIHVGQRVRLQRQRRGLSQTQVASAVGLTFQQLQKYERGTNRISSSKLFELSKVLGVPVGYFFDEVSSERSAANENFGPEHPLACLLGTAEGAELARAFPKVRNPEHRRKILGLVQALSEL